MSDEPACRPAPLRDSQYRALIEHGLDLLTLLDASGRMVYAGPSAKTVLGWEPEEIIGKSGFDLLHPDDNARHVETLAGLVGSRGMRIAYEFRLRHKDGSYRLLEATVQSLLHDPDVAAIVINARDVTERRAAVDALQRSEARFRRLAENAQDIITRFEMLPVPHYEYISPSVERITGYAPSDFYSDPLMHLRLLEPEDLPKIQALFGAPDDIFSQPLTIRWRHKDGRTLWIEQIMVRHHDEQGRVAATETIGRDVTERVLFERKLAESQKLQAVGRVAGGVAHDFNNLLGVISGYASLLARRHPRLPEVAEAVHGIQSAVDRGAALVRQVLSLSRRQAIARRPVDVNATVRELAPILHRLLPSNIRFELGLASDVGVVSADPSQLEQILLNLVINARDAMPLGGTLRVETLAAEESIRLTVADSGEGMSQATKKQIFEPHFTTKDDGTGIGLAVVKQIVAELDGSISVESSPEQGTCFSIALPLCFELMSQESSSVCENSEAGSETILVVEDDELLREVVCELLRANGYRVLLASSPGRALAMAAEAKVDLLLSDVGMPEMSGYELRERFSSAHPEVPVVLMSGYDQGRSGGHVASEPPFVAKPFTEHELAAKIRAALAAAAKR